MASAWRDRWVVCVREPAVLGLLGPRYEAARCLEERPLHHPILAFLRQNLRYARSRYQGFCFIVFGLLLIYTLWSFETHGKMMMAPQFNMLLLSWSRWWRSSGSRARYTSALRLATYTPCTAGTWRWSRHWHKFLILKSRLLNLLMVSIIVLS